MGVATHRQEQTGGSSVLFTPVFLNTPVMLPKVNSERWLSLEDLEGEIWIPVLLGDHEYKVSNLGRIKEPGYTCYRRARGGLRKFAIKPFIKVSKDNGKGYHSIVACGSHYYVHRVVAESFVPNLYKYPEVDHINGAKEDNRAENLRWVDRVGNMANPLTKIKHRAHSNDQFVPIIQIDAVSGCFIKEWQGISEASRELGIRRENISAMVRGTGGKTLKGFRFVYKSQYNPDADYRVKYKRGTYVGTKVISDRWVVVFKKGCIEQIFSNVQTAADFFQCSCSGISKRCRNKKEVRKQKTSIADCAFLYFKDVSADERSYIEHKIADLFVK